MGNTSCFPISKSSAKLIFWEGTTRTLHGKTVAGKIMFEFPDRMVCHADSFFIGHPIPTLSIHDHLIPGKTYFVLPLDCFTSNVLSASSIAALGSSPKRSPINFKDCPFEYTQGSNGKILIKVMPDFIISLITRGRGLCEEEKSTNGSPSHGSLCSTPELKKHYDQLVGSREQVWSPKLDTISEYKIRFSPCRLMGLEWKQRETTSV